MRDPFEVVARLQEQEQRRHANSTEARQQKARKELKALFEERGTDEVEHRNLAG